MSEDDKAREEVLKADARRHQLRLRAELISDASFLMLKAVHRLQAALRYYPDLSRNPDFDESHDVTFALRLLEFAREEIEDGDYGTDYETREKMRKEAEFQNERD